MEIFKLNKVYDFMGKRLPFLGLSAIFVIASLIILFTKGLNFGVDFSGGTIVQIKYESVAPISDIRKELNKVDKFSNSNVVKFGSDEEIILKMSASSASIENDIADEVKVAIKNTGPFEIRRVDMIGPKVGGELKEKGILALSLAIIVILAYVSYRFEWRFAVASIFALIHDVTITLGVIALFNVDINLDILAAILTILGYSLNDTIIVFDRIREGIETSKEKELNSVVNDSVSKTLTRTILTSFTTFFVVFTLYLFGGEIINGFSFTLLVGIIAGTYSSIFVAASFLMQFKFSISSYRQKEAEKLKIQQEKDRRRKMFEQGTM